MKRRPEPLGADTARHDTARDSWHKLNFVEQEELLAELIETRASEFRRAYPDIIAIGYGIRTQTRGKRRYRKERELALKFMVRRKWSKNSPLQRSSRGLPCHVFAYRLHEGDRVLCNIPTDVEERKSYRGCRPQQAVLVSVSAGDSSAAPERGSIACAVRVPGDTTSIYAMSAAHLFDLAEEYWPAIPSQVRVSNSTSGSIFAEVSDYVGPLREAEQGMSFDAALANVSDPAGLASVFGGVQPTRSVASSSEIPQSYGISTARGMLNATKATTWVSTDQVLEYKLGGNTVRIQHSVLIESDANTIPGDSGAPVISLDGDTLIGMNIYGGKGISFMIPAFSLLASGNYAGLPSGQLTLVTHFA